MDRACAGWRQQSNIAKLRTRREVDHFVVAGGDSNLTQLKGRCEVDHVVVAGFHKTVSERRTKS